MKEKLIFSWLLIMATQIAYGQKSFTINVTNRSNMELNAHPVTVKLQPNIKSAIVKLNGKEIPKTARKSPAAIIIFYIGPPPCDDGSLRTVEIGTAGHHHHY